MNLKTCHKQGRSHSLAARVLFFLIILPAVGCLLFLSAVAAPFGFPFPEKQKPRATVIIDAGHGGEDGGTVGVNGALEKELNLSVAKELAGLLSEAGVEVILTRNDDRLLYREEENIKGHRKEYDLKNRLEVAKGHPGAIFISIHMNSFQEARYHGLQVYYAKTEGSQCLAEAIQASVKERLQPENKRRVQKASSSIYLLENAVGCAVLVECGFLSNPEECARLTEKDYQTQLCFSVFCGIMKYIEESSGGIP